LIGVLVLSHWILDLVVHRADLGLLGDTGRKLGFGLWDHPGIEMPLELAVLLVGFAVYLRVTRAQSATGRWTPWLMLAGLLVLQAINWFGPVRGTNPGFSLGGLAAYGICAALGYMLDRTRVRKVA
jgi:hypothetical protein